MTTTTENSEKIVPAVPMQIDLRDWFAGQAVAWAGMKEWASYDEKHAAERAYRLADAMLAARKGGAA